MATDDAKPASEPPHKKRRIHKGPSAAKLLEERRNLPLWSAREKLIERVKAHRTLIVVGETGSGKTTQIPQFLYEAGFAKKGRIACTQPRRVAACTVAKRVSDEMGTKLGELVGYSVRFDDTTSAQTKIKYLTDGMLLREALLDPKLSRYSVVIVDEAHERTVHTDVLLGLLKGVLKLRGDDFRLIVMSATLDAQKFCEYFDGAEAAYIQGRQFPVQVMYTLQPEDNYLDAAINATLQIHCEQAPGDILVFLTGQDEIVSAERLLQDRARQLPAGAAALQLLVVPIYAALPPEQQMRAFEPAPEGTRKAILATNIAETSITIAGVRYVVDPGFVKARGYNAKLGAESLQVVPVSQAQARQRSGRAGREAPGQAYRLFTEASFAELAPSTAPEIQRSNLASVVLQLKAMGIADVVNFDFMDPPPKAALVRSLELLYALGALERDGQLSRPLGANMARLPVDPMYAKVLLSAAAIGCSQEALQVVAMVSADNVFFSPRDKSDEVRATRAKFISKQGDHLTLLAVMKAYLQVPQQQRAQWCSDNFLNIRALRKACDICAQLQQHLQQLQLPVGTTCGDDATPLRRALAAGLFPHAAARQLDGSYRVLATGQPCHLHPSSVLCSVKPAAVVFNEMVRTSKQYARDVCEVEQRWLAELAPGYFAAKAGGAAAAAAAAAGTVV